MGSEPNIYDNRVTATDSTETPCNQMKSHNSDSEISRRTEQNKVLFTLGDDTSLQNIESQRLVRISSNNDGDHMGTYLEENVKRICSEINDFCTELDDKYDSTKDGQERCDIAENINALIETSGTNEFQNGGSSTIDIAKHMEARMSASFEGAEIQDGVCSAQDGCRIQDGGCQEYLCAKDVVKDVIVIASAEVKLDTGQGDVGALGEVGEVGELGEQS